VNICEDRANVIPAFQNTDGFIGIRQSSVRTSRILMSRHCMGSQNTARAGAAQRAATRRASHRTSGGAAAVPQHLRRYPEVLSPARIASNHCQENASRRLRRCSQLRRVLTETPIASAKFLCVHPIEPAFRRMNRPSIFAWTRNTNQARALKFSLFGHSVGLLPLPARDFMARNSSRWCAAPPIPVRRGACRR
jgi:hypothetical protein